MQVILLISSNEHPDESLLCELEHGSDDLTCLPVAAVVGNEGVCPRPRGCPWCRSLIRQIEKTTGMTVASFQRIKA